MPIKELDPHRLGMDEDWEGNNAAFRCPICGKVFIVNSTRMHHGERNCPNCRKSIARITGGRKQGAKATIEWPDSKGKHPLISKNEFRRAASASLGNAMALYEDAFFLLFGAQRYARSLSLSVIGVEEIGKAILYALAALDTLPDLRQKLERSKRGNPAHLHLSKQLLHQYADIAYWQVSEYLQILAQETGELASVSDVEWLTQLFVVLVRDPSVGKVNKPSKADKKLLTFNESKERGLYVDLSPKSDLSTPEQINAKEAERELTDLKSTLNDLSRLSRVLESDDEWQLLEKSVQTASLIRIEMKR